MINNKFKLDANLIKANVISPMLSPNKIILSNRKTIAIIINDESELIVRAPYNTKENKIYEFLNKKSNWIIRKRNETAINKYPKLELINSGEIIYILGESLKTVINSSIHRVKREENYIYIPSLSSHEKLKSYLIKFAKKFISARVEFLANLFNLEYKSISIRSSTTRWGSCGYNNSLNFTYKLIMCPLEIVDYIIIHELAHIKEKNHGSKFYDRVEEMMPNYKQAEKWLKTNRSIIHVI